VKVSVRIVYLSRAKKIKNKITEHNRNHHRIENFRHNSLEFKLRSLKYKGCQIMTLTLFNILMTNNQMRVALSK
jgi:hypothetical protein